MFRRCGPATRGRVLAETRRACRRSARPSHGPRCEGARYVELMEAALTPGTAIGPYRIEGVLGAGGMGRVYRAFDTRLDRSVALKFVDRLFFADAPERLVREARAAARLDHPNICSIYEVVDDESRCFIVMQDVEGETLLDRIAREAIDIREALKIASQIADALAEAHAKGIVHRDIKPQNIIITPRGLPKVLDFGLAASVPPLDASGSNVGDSHSASDTEPIAGTVAYMSPEQALGQELDARTDLYSLAVVLFEMATGVSPFRAPQLRSRGMPLSIIRPPSCGASTQTCQPSWNALFSKGLRKAGSYAISRLRNCWPTSNAWNAIYRRSTPRRPRYSFADGGCISGMHWPRWRSQAWSQRSCYRGPTLRRAMPNGGRTWSSRTSPIPPRTPLFLLTGACSPSFAGRARFSIRGRFT